MSNEQMAKTVFERIASAMDSIMSIQGTPIRWFHCFGTMLEYVADRTFKLENDIDLGVFFEELDSDNLQRSFESLGYKVRTTIETDTDHRPLNIHCEPAEQRIAGTPTVDIYAFFPKGQYFLYTYDYDMQGRKVPSRYVWKKCRKEHVAPRKERIADVRSRAHPEASLMLDESGIWRYDVFEDHGSYKMRLPFCYGTLLDEWYPGWRFRQYYRGQSQSPDGKVIVRSCGEL